MEVSILRDNEEIEKRRQSQPHHYNIPTLDPLKDDLSIATFL